ncbi:MAG: radical SAM protein [Armatimonadota bacterium]
MPASYLDMSTEVLQERITAAEALLSPCTLCPRQCGIDRLAGEQGYCDTGAEAKIASAGPHYGEERPLVGSGGSGTIFFAGCNMGCVFCQNYDISHLARGRERSAQELADMMLSLQKQGCHNINVVTPSHVVPQILQALSHAIDGGLEVPLVYNSGGYDAVETLKLLDGIVDIYMPDAKYADPETARELSDAPDYPEVMKAALTEMHRQVGDLTLDDRGVAVRGLLVRHLVLPEDLAATQQVMEFIASLSTDTYVNVMDQYRPCYRADEYEGINRRLHSHEYEAAVQATHDAGLHRLDDRNRPGILF